MSVTSKEYWERRYRRGGNSGAGSYGRLQDYKAQFVRRFVELNGVDGVIDFGCGDGNFAAVADLPAYTGVDVSGLVVTRNRERFAVRPGHSFYEAAELANLAPHELALSLDVIFHLLEDHVFEQYIQNVFQFAKRYVIIYSSNVDADGPAPHVKHRNFSAFVKRTLPEWSLAAHVPNNFPYDRANPGNTSFADFYVYRRPGEACLLDLPAQNADQ